MLFRLSMAAALIAATVVIQALFMSAGLNTFKRIEENEPGAMTHKSKTVAAVAIAAFWCVSAVGTTVGTAVGVTSLATVIKCGN
jgi:hypothetical protein